MKTIVVSGLTGVSSAVPRMDVPKGQCLFAAQLCGSVTFLIPSEVLCWWVGISAADQLHSVALNYFTSWNDFNSCVLRWIYSI